MKVDESSIFTALIVAFVLFTVKFFYKRVNPLFIKVKDLLNNSEEIRALQENLAILECRFEGLIYLLPSAIFITDLDGNMIFGNPAWLKMVGGENIEDFYGHQWMSVIEPASRDEVERQSERMRKHPGSFYDQVNFRKVNSGIIIKTMCRSVVIKNKKHTPVQMFGILYIII